MQVDSDPSGQSVNIVGIGNVPLNLIGDLRYQVDDTLHVFPCDGSTSISVAGANLPIACTPSASPPTTCAPAPAGSGCPAGGGEVALMSLAPAAAATGSFRIGLTCSTAGNPLTIKVQTGRDYAIMPDGQIVQVLSDGSCTLSTVNAGGGLQVHCSLYRNDVHEWKPHRADSAGERIRFWNDIYTPSRRRTHSPAAFVNVPAPATSTGRF